MAIEIPDGRPVFVKVADRLAEAIAEGLVADGERIPSTTEISTAYQINPATVLKGMNLLVDRGLLEKRRGLGMTSSRLPFRLGAREERKQQWLTNQS